MFLSLAFVVVTAGLGEFMSYSRFAIYYVPPAGKLADFGARWLGWDLLRGTAVTQLPISGLEDITDAPRKYGFHGTIKPPFHLAEGRCFDELQAATSALALTLSPARCRGLELTLLDGFLALTPQGDLSELRRMAEICVQGLDEFRAPPSEEEVARRLKNALSERQKSLLARWGYPYVMDEFRFHMTLSARLLDVEKTAWVEAARHSLAALPVPFVIDRIALCGEREDGRFEQIHSYALAG
ncbi:MAG: DUF1045 domain-containing protein [Pseudomonadota bacterium]